MEEIGTWDPFLFFINDLGFSCPSETVCFLHKHFFSFRREWGFCYWARRGYHDKFSGIIFTQTRWWWFVYNRECAPVLLMDAQKSLKFGQRTELSKAIFGKMEGLSAQISARGNKLQQRYHFFLFLFTNTFKVLKLITTRRQPWNSNCDSVLCKMLTFDRTGGMDMRHLFIYLIYIFLYFSCCSKFI